MPNLFGIINKKYIFSDGQQLTIKQILNQIFYKLPKSTQNIDNENINFLMKSINIEIINKIKKNLLKNNIHGKVKVKNYC